MKFFSLFVFTSLLLAACNNKADQPAIEEDSTNTPAAVYSWQSVLNDSTGRLEMKKVEAVGPDSLSPAAVIKYLNTTNSNVQLVFVKIAGDTAYLKIPDPMYLTQQMGSTGPTLYLSQVIYNLTEIPGVKYVNLDFEEGDHASPGTYNRDSFKDE
jgi:Sporulation and spore germination